MLHQVFQGKSILQNIRTHIEKPFDELATRHVLIESASRKAINWVFFRESGQSGRCPNALSHEQLGRCACSQECMGLAQ